MKKQVIYKCNEVNCACPVIEKIEKENETFYLITDDFENKITIHKEKEGKIKLKSKKIMTKANIIEYKLIGMFGNEIYLSENDLEIINRELKK